MSATRRSLFWTIAGLLLATTIAGTLIQSLIAIAVLRPLEARDARTRAELVATRIATDLVDRAAGGAGVDSILARHRTELARPGWVIFRPAGSDTLITSPPGRQRYVGVLFGIAAPDTPRTDPASPPRPRPEVLARRTVSTAAGELGEIVVTRPGRPRGMFGSFEFRAWLLFLPVAAILSVVAGLAILRLLVRRLRALETLAARVTEGDLRVRIADRSGDEIGRLAERLDRMTERLAEARDRIAATESQRRRLFADITHELATPLTSIRGYAETLLDPGISTSNEERTRYVRGVLEESRRLDRLIRDLFELARLEAGASPLALEPLDWVALCRNTVQRFEPRFRQAGLALRWAGSTDEKWVEADGHRLEMVLENLLANALRYVPEGGGIEVGIEATADGRFRLEVSDDGPGLPPEELPFVFERFYRGSGARDHGGSGLGLAIVREIVARHGGAATAENRSPRGLTIAVVLPPRA